MSNKIATAQYCADLSGLSSGPEPNKCIVAEEMNNFPNLKVDKPYLPTQAVREDDINLVYRVTFRFGSFSGTMGSFYIKVGDESAFAGGVFNYQGSTIVKEFTKVGTLMGAYDPASGTQLKGMTINGGSCAKYPNFSSHGTIYDGMTVNVNFIS